MTSTPATARGEGIRALFGQGAPILWANVGVGALVVATLWQQVPRVGLAAWFVALSLLTAIRAALQRRYLHSPPDEDLIEGWGRRFVLGSTISGLLWGAAGVSFFVSGNPLSQSVLTFAIGGMIAAAAGTLACHPPAFFGYFALALAPLTLRVLMEGDRLHYGMGAMLLAYALGMQRVARNNHATFLRAFRLGLKNADLLAEVSLSRLDLEEANRTLEARVAQRTDELERQSETLRKAQRLEVAGKLAGGLAHDFNSLLTVVLNNAALLKESRALDEQGKLAADEMLEAAGRGEALIRQLLAFTGPKRAEPRVIDLHQLLEEWAGLLRRMLGDAVTVELALSAQPIYVHADPAHVEQVLVNLAARARSGMPHGGHLLLATQTCAVLDDPDLAPGEYAELRVEDSGARTVAAAPRGLGSHLLGDGEPQDAGLSRVLTIVEGWGGRLRFETQPGGTCARLRIPARSKPASSQPVARPDQAPARSSQATVLVVEDEPTLRSVIRRSLLRDGFRVLVAEDGERALQVARDHASTIDLLITDVVMPGVSGPELARRLVTERPQLGVLFISGYTFEHALPAGSGSNAVGYLSKPFDTKVLSAKVLALLSARPAADSPR